MMIFQIQRRIHKGSHPSLVKQSPHSSKSVSHSRRRVWKQSRPQSPGLLGGGNHRRIEGDRGSPTRGDCIWRRCSRGWVGGMWVNDGAWGGLYCKNPFCHSRECG